MPLENSTLPKCFFSPFNNIPVLSLQLRCGICGVSEDILTLQTEIGILVVGCRFLVVMVTQV